MDSTIFLGSSQSATQTRTRDSTTPLTQSLILTAISTFPIRIRTSSPDITALGARPVSLEYRCLYLRALARMLGCRTARLFHRQNLRPTAFWMLEKLFLDQIK